MSDLHDLDSDSAVYKTLLESTQAIPWKIDWASMTFAYIGPQIEPLLGWSRESWISANDWAERMHPEDREFVVNFCISQSQAGVDHEADYRALTKDNGFVWVREVVHVLCDEHGETSALIGFTFDITEQKKAEQLQAFLTAFALIENHAYPVNAKYYLQTCAHVLSDIQSRAQQVENLTETYRDEVRQMATAEACLWEFLKQDA